MSSKPSEPVAIVGAGCRFPGGADDLASYWRLLAERGDGLCSVPLRRWSASDYYDASASSVGKSYARTGGFLADLEGFDHGFFGISAREAASMDPQQRLLLEVTWQALEDAGIPPMELAGSATGVFVGIASNDYVEREVLAGNYEFIHPFSGTGNFHGVAAGRLSFSLGLTGPSMAIDAGCASSLVALHHALLSLRAGDCELAIVAGVNAMISPASTIYLCKAGVLAADGRCRSFDARAAGYVRGEGCGVVVLRLASAAARASERVRALVRGSAVNHNGTSARLTAPKREAQQEVIERALSSAGLAPTEVGYVEAHGTASPLGDLIELRALSDAYRCANRVEPLRIGCVKTNIGHLESAAGMASLLKVLVALEHEQLPPNFQPAVHNPKLPKAGLRLLDESEPWRRSERVRAAGLSSFSISGSNVHVLVSERSEPEPKATSAHGNGPTVLVLSAKTPTALRLLSKRYQQLIEHAEPGALADLCEASLHDRQAFAHRLAVVASTSRDFVAALAAYVEGQPHAQIHAGQAPPGLRRVALDLQLPEDALTLRSAVAASLAPLGLRLVDADVARAVGTIRWSGTGLGDSLCAVVAQLFVAGFHIDLKRARARERGAVPLPHYPFEHTAHWIDGPRHDGTASAVAPERLTAASAPGETLHEQLRDIWQEVLGVLPSGIDESFLDLGGQSLLATMLVTRIRDRYGVELPLSRMFADSSIRSVATAVEAHRSTPARPSRPPLRVRAGAESIPLTFAQQRMWMVEQVLGGFAGFNLSQCVQLEQRCEQELLMGSFEAMMARHEILRTSFVRADGAPTQVVSAHPPLPFAVTDLRQAEAAQVGQLLLAAVRADVELPFALDVPPLMRVRLLRLPEFDVVALTIHHMLADGWSLGVFVREWATLYAALVRGTSAALPALQVQYADYACWQRGWLSGAVLDAQLAYWIDRLRGSAPLELETDFARPPRPSGRAAVAEIALGAALTRSIASFAAAQRASPYMVLLAAFKLLLYRYTQNPDVVVGTSIANREQRELEGLIGLFMNTVVMRTEFAPGDDFRTLVERVRDDCLQAYMHQDAPFEKIVEQLAPARDLSRNPMFQVAFVFQNMPSGLRLTGAAVPTLRPCDSQVHTARVDLELQLWDGERGLEGQLIYAADLFAHESMVSLVGHFARLLESAVQCPLCDVLELEFGTASVLPAGLGPTAASERAPLVVEQLSESFRRRPRAIAIEHRARQWTMEELAGRALSIRRQLARRGVVKGARVGVHMERGIDAIASLIAIWQHGAVYVPLDPSYPPERLAFISEDARVVLVIAATALPFASSTPTLHPSPPESESPPFAGDAQAIPCDPAAPAFVLYTSGSQGRPKGIVGTHGMVAARLSWEGVPFAADEVVALKTASNFIDSLWEMLAPLLHGGRVAVIEQESVLDPRKFAEALAANRVTRVVLVPSLLRCLLELPDSSLARVRGVSCWHCSGEALSSELASLFHARLGASAQLVNIYGSTEAWDISWCIVPAQPGYRSIGSPLPFVHCEVVDQRLRPVPRGAVGELCVEGPALRGVGYAETESPCEPAFVFAPRDGAPEARRYRTGDRVRLRGDGTLAYLGRIDAQVKLRGHRIELAEIEERLMRHPAVHRCAAAVQQLGELPALVAFVELVDAGVLPSAGELRAFLASALPEAMLPSQFEVLEELPRTPSGKLDRRALPLCQGRRSDQFVAPRSVLERAIAEVWSHQLGIERVGVRDNFFEVGGHSLLAVAVRGELERRLARAIPMVTLFQHATIEQLASALEEAVTRSDASYRVTARGARTSETLAQRLQVRRSTRN